jgi:hypothetical protein
MFPFLRMNQIYGDMTPPDMNQGPDINGLMSQVYNMISDEHQRQRQHELTLLDRNRLPRIAGAIAGQNIGHPGGSMGNPQDRNVELGPGALEQGKIGISGDKSSLSNVDPKLAATLAFDRDKLNTESALKKEQIQKTDEYHDSLIDSRNRLGDASNKIRADRADIYRYKALHPDMKFMISKGGNIFAMNPNGGEAIDTGVDSGTLSDEDKLNILGDQHISEINARGDNATNLQSMRGNQALEQIAARVAGQKDVNASKPTRELPPTQQRVQQSMSAHELVNKHPELAKWVVFNGDGTFSVSKNAPANVASEINSTIYPSKPAGGTDKKSTTSTTAPAAKTTDMTPPKAPQGWKYIRKPDNSGWTAVPDKGGK